MKNILLLFWVILFVVGISAKDKTQTKITYTIKPDFSNNQLRFKVSASFTTGNSGQTKLDIPKGYGGQQSFEKCISELKATCPHCKLQDTNESNIKIIQHDPKQVVTFEYIFSNAPNLTADENVEADVLPQLKPTSFYFFGLSFWITPIFEKDGKDIDDYSAKVNLNWVDFPADWKMGNSFGFNQRRQTFTGKIGKFSHTGFVGGDYRFITFRIRQTPVTVAVFKDWQFKDEEIESSLKKILTAEGNVWKDFDFPHFFVSIVPPYNPEEAISVNGTAGTNSFFATASKPTPISWLNKLFAHEIFHNWNPIKLGRSIEPKPTWFTEGFTNYYTSVVLLRAGLINLDEFINANNLVIKGYYTSKARNMQLEEVQKKFFSEGVVQRLPYQRGYLLALKWDTEIKEKSKGKYSLETVMQKMLRSAKRKPLALSDQTIIGFINEFTKRDVSGDVENLWVKGETFSLTKRMLPTQIELEKIMIGFFDLGYEPEKSYKANKITALRKDTNAYDAGLREGMEIVDYFYNTNDAQKKATIIIKEEGKERRISFIPEAREKIEVPQWGLKTKITDEEKRKLVDWFSK